MRQSDGQYERVYRDPRGGFLLRFVLVAACLIFCAVVATVVAIVVVHTGNDEPDFQLRDDANFTLRFFLLGDWGTASLGQQEVAEQMIRLSKMFSIDFIVSLGDNFYPSGVDSVDSPLFRNYFEDIYNATELPQPWYITLGNVDHQGNISALIDYSKLPNRWIMPSSFYMRTFQVDDATMDMVFLDSETLGNEDRKQYDWLEHILATSEADYLILIAHEPIYSSGSHRTEDQYRGLLKPLLDQYPISAYFNGHDHSMQHLKFGNIHEFTCGSGGAMLSKVYRMEYTRFAIQEHGFLFARISSDVLEVNYVSRVGNLLYQAHVLPRTSYIYGDTPSNSTQASL